MFFAAIVFLYIIAPSLSFEVSTERTTTAVRGRSISLPCNFSTDTTAPYHVYWFRHNFTGSPDGVSILVAQEFKGEDEVPGGKKYNITDNYELVIYNVSVSDETTYSCQVVIEGADDRRNYTDLRVIALANPLEPVIKSCEVTDPGRCTFLLSNDRQSEIKLECKLYDVRPLVNVTWIRSDAILQQTADPQILTMDGLSNISLQLEVSSYDFDYDFTCEAKGEAVRGISSMTATFKKKGLHAGYIVLIIAILVLLAAAVIYFVYKRYGFLCTQNAGKQTPVEEVDMAEAQPLNQVEHLRRTISDYAPGKLTDKVLKTGRTFPNQIRLAVVGSTGAGKSSFVRSLKYAYSAVFNKEIEIYKGMAAGGVTLKPAFYKIDDSIHVQDNRGMRDFDTQQIGRIIQELGTNQVCLLIAIFRPRELHPEPLVGEFLRDLSMANREKFASYPMVIVTHRDKITDEDERRIILDKVANGMDILPDNVRFVENFQEEPENESSHCQQLVQEFLEILHSMLIKADSNLVQQLNERVQMGENSTENSYTDHTNLQNVSIKRRFLRLFQK